MANEYGSVDALKKRLNIELSDTTRDDLLLSALGAASRGVERATGRRFWLDPAPVARVYNPRRRLVREVDGELLLTDDIGDTTGMVVETGSGTSYTPVTDYETWPENALADGKPVTGLLRIFGIWAVPGMRIRITTRFGWPADPDPVTEASLIQAARLYRRKDSPEGVAASSEWGVVRVSRRDPDVWNLIEPYILPGFG
ncbi:phage gp6-like head-tail connector protein [Streptomyces sp. H39-C1]|uniref:phage gp6-like head-tail connector protein n=1 Tax=Streptomyces sp. H39-C1 TaxID=3004355 RepID=UPI0022B01016|nr:phage gp6-like head-tail connector protein [Streptomyces sp. H39-C1]MCZ4099846.1 phage gp6-like head-tail connector protein [Streptomyces sp. H39-C1]